MSGQFNKLPARQTACNDIIDDFTRMIRNGYLKVNDKLPSERELAEQFGVGRSTLREALKSMTVMGLLEARPGEGTFVRNINADSIKQQLQWSMYLNPAPIQELIELRELIELKNVEKAALNRSDEDIAAIQSSIELMQQNVKNHQETRKYDLMFHMSISKATGNKLMNNLLELTRMQLEEWFDVVLKDPVNVASTIQEHIDILDAIKKKDPNKAKELMKNHLDLAAIRLSKGRFQTINKIEKEA